MNSLLFILALLLQQPERTAAVEGVVKNLKTNTPLADVRVNFTPEGGPPAAQSVSATTDATGRFVIPAVAPGRYAIAATRTLFFQPRRSSAAALVTLAPEQRLRNLEIMLLPTAVIAGRVTDGNRAALRSVRVEALRLEYRDGNRVWVTGAQNTTDDRGEYRLFNLRPGTYLVRATQGAGAALLAPAYYPGVADPQNAAEIRLEAGDETAAIDLTMRPGSEFYAQIKLGGMAALSAPLFTVQRRNSKVAETLVTRTDPLPDNTYRVARLTPGSYDILVRVIPTATAPRGQTVQPNVRSYMAAIPVDISRDNVDLGTLGLRPAAWIHGRLVAPEPLPNPVDPRRIIVSLRPLDLPLTFNASARWGATPNAVSDDGSFVLTNVFSGRYQVTVTGLPAGAYLISARIGAREVLDSGLIVNEDSSPLELAIGGPGAVGDLDGSVVNARGETVPYSTVVLVPAPERRGNPAAFAVATADQAGVFRFRAVLPGDYKILAWEEVEPGAYQNPDFIKDFESRGDAIRIQKGLQHSATVRVITGPK